VDAGEPDKRLLVIEPELAVVLRVIAREANILSGLIRQAWDAGDLGTLTKHSPLRATGAHVSLIGHITEEEVRRYLTETERANGFANRFLWLLVRRSKALPDGTPVPDGVLAPFLDTLRQVVAFSENVGELSRDGEARTLWREVYPTVSEGESGMVGAILNRAEAQVLRLDPVCRPGLLRRNRRRPPPRGARALGLRRTQRAPDLRPPPRGASRGRSARGAPRAGAADGHRHLRPLRPPPDRGGAPTGARPPPRSRPGHPACRGHERSVRHPVGRLRRGRNRRNKRMKAHAVRFAALPSLDSPVVHRCTRRTC
jgi:hypothetical protein